MPAHGCGGDSPQLPDRLLTSTVKVEFPITIDKPIALSQYPRRMITGLEKDARLHNASSVFLRVSALSFYLLDFFSPLAVHRSSLQSLRFHFCSDEVDV